MIVGFNEASVLVFLFHSEKDLKHISNLTAFNILCGLHSALKTTILMKLEKKVEIETHLNVTVGRNALSLDGALDFVDLHGELFSTFSSKILENSGSSETFFFRNSIRRRSGGNLRGR